MRSPPFLAARAPVTVRLAPTAPNSSYALFGLSYLAMWYFCLEDAVLDGKMRTVVFYMWTSRGTYIPAQSGTTSTVTYNYSSSDSNLRPFLLQHLHQIRRYGHKYMERWRIHMNKSRPYPFGHTGTISRHHLYFSFIASILFFLLRILLIHTSPNSLLINFIHPHHTII